MRSVRSPLELPPPIWVDGPESLDALVRDLSRHQAFGVDTESNSLFAYRERVCLIQFSTAEHDYVVDALCFAGLEPLSPIFASPTHQKVFHAAEYDILCLKRDYGFEFAEIFDTMVAARALGWPQTGLASVLEARFGVRLSKKHQRADWGRRPLLEEQVEYARLDTHYLLALRDLQLEELASLNRLEEVSDEFTRLTRLKSESATEDHNAFWRVKGSRDLTPERAAVLRELFLYRERQAARIDRPPFKIMGDRTLMEIAQHLPKTTRGLLHVHGMTSGQIQRHGKSLLEAVQRGLHASHHPRPPRGERVSYQVRQRYNLLLEWRKEKARERGLESDMILPREALWLLARQTPRTLAELEALDIGPWRRKTYGEELIRLLSKSV